MSTYSSDLKLELIGTGEASGTWGDDTNNNLNLIQQAIAGYEAVALSDGGTITLVMTNKTISNARNMVIKFTGTLTTASTVTIPDSIEKFYIFDCSAVVGPTNLTIKTASGTGFTLDAAKIYAAYTDGTNLNEVSLDTLGGTIGSAQIADDAVTLAKMAPGTDGNIISYDASGNPVAVATGTSGQVLTSAGAGAPPTFEDVAGGISWITTPKTATFTVVNGEGYFINSSSAITANLPVGSAGATFAVSDYARNFATYNLTITPNGSEKIGGIADSLILNVDGQAATFVYVDATKGWINVQNAEDTQTGTPPFIVATGGTISTVCTDYKIHTFTGPGTFTVSSLSPTPANNVVDYLVIAGGGGGQWSYGGAGGGGFRFRADPSANPQSGPGAPRSGPAGITVSATAYPITVGAGGTGSPSGPTGDCNSAGSNSIFSSITSAGGGKGGNYTNPGAGQTGVPGGSGGGGGSFPGPGVNPGGNGNTPPVSPPQGSNGGAGLHISCDVGGGGGGAMASGSNGAQPYRGGNGGAGAGITGFGAGNGECSSCVQYFSGGGGGGVPSGGTSAYGNRGIGGGANGKNPSLTPSPACGATNQGGGGGGGWGPSAGAAGGSGIVVIRYKFQ